MKFNITRFRASKRSSAARTFALADSERESEFWERFFFLDNNIYHYTTVACGVVAFVFGKFWYIKGKRCEI